MEGFIKLHRQILESQVFANSTALKIWVWCLLKANSKDKYVSLKVGRGETTIQIKIGQFLFGRFKAEEELGIDGSTIYRWIQKFSTPEFDMITIESNSHYSIITINNWASYQDEDNSKRTTNEQPMNSKRTANELPLNTYKKDNKDKNNTCIQETISIDKNIEPDPYLKNKEYYQTAIEHLQDEHPYKTIIKYILGNNNINTELRGLIALEPMTEQQYFVIRQKFKARDVPVETIAEMLYTMNSHNSLGKHTSLFTMFNAWINNTKN